MKVTLEELKQFAAEIVAIKHTAGDLKLYKTMQALEESVKAVGWEIAEVMTIDPTLLFEKPTPPSGEYVIECKDPKRQGVIKK